jgi:hypothetical protein
MERTDEPLRLYTKNAVSFTSLLMKECFLDAGLNTDLVKISKRFSICLTFNYKSQNKMGIRASEKGI